MRRTAALLTALLATLAALVLQPAVARPSRLAPSTASMTSDGRSTPPATTTTGIRSWAQSAPTLG